MAIITKIEEQKNKKRINVFVDNAFFCGLFKETAVIFKLKEGQFIDESVLKQAIFDSETKSAFDKASEYLANRMYSKRELFDKLYKKGYQKDNIIKAIEKLEEYHYVDDELFAKQFVEQNSKLSKKILECKLKQKGVSSDIVDEVVCLVKEDDEYQNCLAFAEKYAKSKDLSKESALQKMYASLARRGFSFDLIKRVCLKIANGLDIDDFEN